jgi:hypothetical protein
MHREALFARRAFWVILQHRRVTFDKLTRALAHIDQASKGAERTYAHSLQRHAGSVDLTGLYVRFLQDVRCDPWSAAHWSTELERLQAAEDESAQR